MNYNNYYNQGYGVNPYQQQPNYQQNYQPSYQANNKPTTYNYNMFNNNYGFAFVNGIEEAQTFIVNPNCTYFLRDKNSSMCFEKRADNQGRWTLKVYNLVEQDTNSDFVKKDDLSAFQQNVNDKFNQIFNMLQQNKVSESKEV